MLEQILPAGISVAATRTDSEGGDLFPEEQAVVGSAVEKRRREFTTGRACARAALEQLGLPAQAIPSGSKGEPIWPAGVTGSITHCRGYRACAVGRLSDHLAIGIDAEPDEPLPAGLIADIALAPERDSLRRLAGIAPSVHWDRLLFSIKESVYKAWFPLAKRWLGFEDAAVAIDPHLGRFKASLLVPGPELEGRALEGFAGRWLVQDGLVLAAIALPVRNDA